MDASGQWALTDFGSCKAIGEPISSTTEMYYYKPLQQYFLTAPILAHPKYDYYMLLVTLLLEGMPKKNDFKALVPAGAERVSDALVVRAMEAHRGDELHGLLTTLRELAMNE